MCQNLKVNVPFSLAILKSANRGLLAKTKKGRSRRRKSFMHRVYSAQRGIETMVSEGAGPWGRGRSEFANQTHLKGQQCHKTIQNLMHHRECFVELLTCHVAVVHVGVVARLGGRFRCFYFFLPGGGGRGSSRRQEGGGRLSIENPRRGGGLLGEGGGAEGLGGCLQGIWGGGG